MIYTVFLFLVITVLLNLLIAQMSDTYTNVQSDAQRSLFINRAWIVARAEHNSLFTSAFLVRHYMYIIHCSNCILLCRIAERENIPIVRSLRIHMVCFTIVLYVYITYLLFCSQSYCTS